MARSRRAAEHLQETPDRIEAALLRAGPQLDPQEVRQKMGSEEIADVSSGSAVLSDRFPPGGAQEIRGPCRRIEQPDARVRKPRRHAEPLPKQSMDRPNE